MGKALIDVTVIFNSQAFINTLDNTTLKKLAIRSLRRGIGSMDYIQSLLIMEDDLDENMGVSDDGEDIEQQEAEDIQPQDVAEGSAVATTNQQKGTMATTQGEAIPPWCVCSNCRPMPQEVENKCCKLKNCITLSSQFIKLCLDTDVLQLCIRNTSDIRNDREDNSTRAFCKAAYRQFTLARHGYLGKGSRRVCPSCVVLKIRQRYPSVTGVYMGYRER